MLNIFVYINTKSDTRYDVFNLGFKYTLVYIRTYRITNHHFNTTTV